MNMLETGELLLELQEKRLRCQEALNKLPRGTLSIYRKHNTIYYLYYCDGVRKYLHRDDPLIQKLIDRHMLEEEVKHLDTNIALLSPLVEGYQVIDPNVLLQGFSPAYANPSPVVFQTIGAIDSRDWETSSYRRSQRHPENLTITTKKGDRVRSRIESWFMDLYEELGVQVHYEEEFRTPSGLIINTDMTLLIPFAIDLKYHEHLGRMDDPNYTRKFLWKHEQYLRAGLIPFRDILYTFEGPDGEVDFQFLRQQVIWFVRQSQVFKR